MALKCFEEGGYQPGESSIINENEFSESSSCETVCKSFELFLNKRDFSSDRGCLRHLEFPRYFQLTSRVYFSLHEYDVSLLPQSSSTVVN